MAISIVKTDKHGPESRAEMKLLIRYKLSLRLQYGVAGRPPTGILLLVYSPGYCIPVSTHEF
jgi:hypothetical protein